MAEPQRPSRSLPDNPDLRHLKKQAKDLLRAGDASSLAEAQFQLSREYGFPSWPKLKAHVESLRVAGKLKAAIDANDLPQVAAMMTEDPALHSAPLGYRNNGPLTWAAECRGTLPTPDRLAIARWLIENGSDVHQGGDGPLMRAALFDERIPMMELLVKYGANVNALWGGDYPIIFAPCETLQAGALRWLIDHNADLKVARGCVRMLIATAWRNPAGKHGCLEVFAEAGYVLPDTAPVAIHRGRIDLLDGCLNRDPNIIHRHFAEADIFPVECGIEPGAACTCATLEGATLLHMAVEYHELEIVKWLIDRGADVDARATVDADGVGGHTPLFHTILSPFSKAAELARLLMWNGADANARATFRKPLPVSGDATESRTAEVHETTPIGFARSLEESKSVNEDVIVVIREFGGE